MSSVVIVVQAEVKMEADQRIRGTPKQTGARARAHVVLKPVLIVSYWLYNFLNVTCQNASRSHSAVDRYLPEGLRAKRATHCLAPLKLTRSSFMALA